MKRNKEDRRVERRSSVSAATVDRLYRSGKSTRQIAEETGLSLHTVHARMKEAGTVARPDAARLGLMRRAKARLDARTAVAALE